MRHSDNDRRELADRYQAVVARVSAILFKQDPIGIAEDNPHTDEYDAEARLIVARSTEAMSPAELSRITRGVFVEMFWEELAEPASRFDEISKELWPVVQELHGS
jgi:hypothetical protein